MSTLQLGALNAEILRNLGIVAEDEGALQRVAKYLRRVARELTSDPTEMTREEFFKRVDEVSKCYPMRTWKISLNVWGDVHYYLFPSSQERFARLAAI